MNEKFYGRMKSQLNFQSKTNDTGCAHLPQKLVLAQVKLDAHKVSLGQRSPQHIPPNPNLSSSLPNALPLSQSGFLVLPTPRLSFATNSKEATKNGEESTDLMFDEYKIE